MPNITYINTFHRFLLIQKIPPTLMLNSPGARPEAALTALSLFPRRTTYIHTCIHTFHRFFLIQKMSPTLMLNIKNTHTYKHSTGSYLYKRCPQH